MKKTLIAILALGSVAMASHTSSTRELVALDSSTLPTVYAAGLGNTTDTKITGSNETIDFNNSTTLSSYIITFAFDTLPSDSKDAFLRMASGNDNAMLSVSYIVSSGKASISLTRSDFSARMSAFGDTLSANTTDTYALTVYKSEDNTRTLYLSNLTTHELVTVAQDDFPSELSKFDLTSGTAKAYSAGGTILYTVGQVADLSSVDPYAIEHVAKYGSTPEPATATLSLLALAGLAARRKRH